VARSNYSKSSHLRAAPVPNVYLFDAVSTKTAGSRRFNNGPFFSACMERIQSPCGERVALEAGSNVPGISFPGPFWSPAARGNAYPTPRNARKDHFRSVRDPRVRWDDAMMELRV
jgi:hypothetical protein